MEMFFHMLLIALLADFAHELRERERERER